MGSCDSCLLKNECFRLTEFPLDDYPCRKCRNKTYLGSVFCEKCNKEECRFEYYNWDEKNTSKPENKQNNKLNAVKHRDGNWWIYVGDDDDDILLEGLGCFESKEVAERVIKAFSCKN